MIEFKGTPGPWVVDEKMGTFFIGPYDKIYGGVAGFVCKIQAHPATISNAHLIAAAPDLLEALKSLIEDLEMRSKDGVVDCSHGIYCDSRQAIAKALGETK